MLLAPGCVDRGPSSPAATTVSTASTVSREVEDRLIARAVEDLVARHPELRGLSVDEVGPVFVDASLVQVGVAAELRLPDPLEDVSIELVHGELDAAGEIVGVPERARIRHLRGLELQVAIASGRVISLVPSASPETQVEYLAD